MFLVGSLAIVLASASTTAFPGGMIDVPRGCTAPAKISMVGDGFMGGIKCPKEGLDILVYGDLYTRRPCEAIDKKAPAAQRESLEIPIPGGTSIFVCTLERKHSRTQAIIKEMMIDLGPAQLVTEVRTPRQAFVLLQIAMSFRAPSAEGSK